MHNEKLPNHKINFYFLEQHGLDGIHVHAYTRTYAHTHDFPWGMKNLIPQIRNASVIRACFSKMNLNLILQVYLFPRSALRYGRWEGCFVVTIFFLFLCTLLIVKKKKN